MKELIKIGFAAHDPKPIDLIMSAWELISGSRGDGISDFTADNLESIARIAIDTIPTAIASRKKRGLSTSGLESLLEREN